MQEDVTVAVPGWTLHRVCVLRVTHHILGCRGAVTGDLQCYTVVVRYGVPSGQRKQVTVMWHNKDINHLWCISAALYQEI